MFDLGGKPSDVGSKCSLTHIHPESLDDPFAVGMKQCKCMVVLRKFPQTSALFGLVIE